MILSMSKGETVAIIMFCLDEYFVSDTSYLVYIVTKKKTEQKRGLSYLVYRKEQF